MINLVGNGFDIDLHGEQVNVPAITRSIKNLHITNDGSVVSTVKDNMLEMGKVPHWGKYIFTLRGLCDTVRNELIDFIKSIGFDEFQLTSVVTNTTDARFIGNIFEIVNELRHGGATISLEVEAKDANSAGPAPTVFITETLDTLVTEDVEDILVKE